MSDLVYLNGELYHASDFSDEYLAHYGVKGMRWGKRKARKAYRSGKISKDQYKSAKKDLKKQGREYKLAKRLPGMVAYNKAAEYINAELPSLNKRYEGVNLTNTKSKAYERYIKEYQEIDRRAAKKATREVEDLLRNGVKYNG